MQNIPPAISRLQSDLPNYATELKVDSDTDRSEGMLYFRLKTDGTETHDQYTKPASAVAVKDDRIVEFDIRIGEYTVEQVKEVLDNNSHRLPLRLDDGEGRRSVTHVRNWDCNISVDAFLRFVSGLVRDVSAMQPREN